MKALDGPQLQDTPNPTQAMRRCLSCVEVPSRLPDEQERRRQKLGKLFAENFLKSDFCERLDSAPGTDSLAPTADDDAGYTPRIEHRLESANHLPFRLDQYPTRAYHCRERLTSTDLYVWAGLS